MTSHTRLPGSLRTGLAAAGLVLLTAATGCASNGDREPEREDPFAVDCRDPADRNRPECRPVDDRGQRRDPLGVPDLPDTQVPGGDLGGVRQPNPL